MDAAQGVVEEVVEDIFAGLTFSQACEMLFAKCKSNAPSSEGFQNMIDYIRGVHEAMGLEFDCGEYWNEGTISGSHQVFPLNLGNSLNQIPDVLSKEYLNDLIEKLGSLEASTIDYRRNHERVVNRRNGQNTGGVIDTRALTRSANTVPVYIPPGASDDDDFI